MNRRYPNRRDVSLSVSPESDVENRNVDQPKRRRTEDNSNWKLTSYLNDPVFFNRSVVEKNPVYKQLRKGISELEEKMRESKKPRGGRKRGPKSEILQKLRKEGVDNYSLWAKRAANARTRDWPMDYVVACESRKLGAELTKRMLVKYSGFPVPSWSNGVDPEGELARSFHKRQLECDLMEQRLRLTVGDDQFERDYSGRHLQWERGVTSGCYVESQAALYRNELLAIEDEWNRVNAAAGLPEILIEDWLGDYRGLEAIRDYKFLSSLVLSPEVEQLLKGAGRQLSSHYCPAGCKCNGSGSKDCCLTNEDFSILACTAECGCGIECEGRFIERGRPVRVCIFREPLKGWGVRALSEIGCDDFIGEFQGELRVGPSKGDAAMFDFCMKKPTSEGKEGRLLTIAAANMGNEGRFFNHSCHPNIYVSSVQLDRYGPFFARKCFFAKRRILPGEELLFDYFPSGLNGRHNIFFENCACGTNRCKCK